VGELFERITGDGKKIVLATSGKEDDTDYYVDLLKIGKFVDGCISGDEVGRSKPKPDLFTAGVDKFKLNRDETVVVGDTRWDVEAAARAGLRTIAVTCGGFEASLLRAAGAIAVFKDPADILENYDKLKSETASRSESEA